MADVLSIEINTRDLEKAVRFFPKQLKMQLGDAFDHISLHFLKEFRAKRLQGPPGERGSPEFYRQFRRSFFIPTGGDIKNMGVEIFSESKVAGIQQTGGVETSKTGQRIPVPLSARQELFSRTGKLKKKYKRPGQLKNIVPIILKGQTFLARVKKHTRDILPLFVLKRSITLKPRLGFYELWDTQENWRIERLNRAINNTLWEA
jgi:hypothetical protein